MTETPLTNIVLTTLADAPEVFAAIETVLPR